MAVADLMAIIDYISDDNPDAAQALKEDIEAKKPLARIRRSLSRARAKIGGFM